MENDALPPEGTFSRLMSIDKPPEKPAGNQSPGHQEIAKERSNDRSFERSNVQTNKRTNEATNVDLKQRKHEASNVGSKKTTNERSNEDGIYAISIPASRRPRRASFDIFDDQKVALDKLQLAAVDAGEKRPKLGEMIQEAIDLYVQRRAKQLPHIRLRRETDD
jgi:hypothetical protein